jgi:glyoxylase-like metal-dependent hydrolase (beta-lactamase superfamily II)
MQIQKFTLGDLRSNCYIVFEDMHAFIVDPGYESQAVIDFIETNDLVIDFIYLTHGHIDHVGGVKQLKEKYHAKVYAPKKDIFWMTTYTKEKLGYDIPVDVLFAEPFEFEWLDLKLKFYDTPGHSEGGTILWIEDLDVMFSGDTLFFQTIGRTDIPYADTATLIKSIERIYQLFPNQTRIYPGHGRTSEIGHEKKYNPYVKSNT